MEQELRYCLLEDFPELHSAFSWIDALPWDPRPDGDYRNHLTRVAGRLAYQFGERRLAYLQAALLHDCLEDQSQAIEARHQLPAAQALQNEFGVEVRLLVEALTTHGDYFSHVEQLLQGPAAIIKLSDFCDNALRLDALAPERRTKLQAKYAPVGQLFARWLDDHPLAGSDDIRRQLAQL